MQTIPAASVTKPHVCRSRAPARPTVTRKYDRIEKADAQTSCDVHSSADRLHEQPEQERAEQDDERVRSRGRSSAASATRPGSWRGCGGRCGWRQTPRSRTTRRRTDTRRTRNEHGANPGTACVGCGGACRQRWHLPLPGGTDAALHAWRRQTSPLPPPAVGWPSPGTEASRLRLVLSQVVSLVPTGRQSSTPADRRTPSGRRRRRPRTWQAYPSHRAAAPSPAARAIAGSPASATKSGWWH